MNIDPLNLDKRKEKEFKARYKKAEKRHRVKDNNVVPLFWSCEQSFTDFLASLNASAGYAKATICV